MSIDLSTSTLFGTAVTVSTTTATATTMPANAAHGAYLDYGAGYFTKNWYLNGDINISAASASGASLSISVEDQAGIAWVAGSGTDNGVALFFSADSSTAYRSALRQKVASTQVSLGGAYVYSVGATHYYYTLYNLSSIGGQYGGWLSIVYSDSARTAHLESFLYKLTASNSSQYLYPMQSLNNGTTPTLSATNANLTLGTVSAGADLTLYTKSGATLAVYPDVIVATALTANETSYVVRDFGVGGLTSIDKLYGVLNQTAWPAGTAGKYFLNAVTNTANSAFDGAAVHGQAIAGDWLSATTTKVRLVENVAGSLAYSTASITHTLSTPLWFKRRVDPTIGTYGTMYLQAYYDPARLVAFGTEIPLTLRENISYQYHYPVASSSSANTNSATFTFGGVGGVPILDKTRTAIDSFRLTDLLAASKSASSVVSDRVRLTEKLTASKQASSVILDQLRLLDTLVRKNGTLRDIVEVLRSADRVVSSRNSTVAIVGRNLFSDKLTSSKQGAASIVETLRITEKIVYTSLKSDTFKRITWYIERQNATTGDYEPCTGLSPTLKFFRDTDALTLDFSDQTFKSFSAAGANISTTFTERDLTGLYYPGYYDLMLKTNGLGAGINTQYQAVGDVADTGLTPNKHYHAEDTMVFKDGVLQWGGMTFDEHTQLMANPTATQIRAAVRDELTAELLDVVNTKAAVDALPSAAEIDAALMSDGLTYAQSKLVNDAILHGVVTGAGTATESFWSVNQASVLVERARITVDASGNRTAVAFVDVNP